MEGETKERKKENVRSRDFFLPTSVIGKRRFAGRRPVEERFFLASFLLSHVHTFVPSAVSVGTLGRCRHSSNSSAGAACACHHSVGSR